MLNTTLTAALTLAFAILPLAGQQLEFNSPGGSLKASGQDPVPDLAFELVPAHGDTALDLETMGRAASPYILALGTLAQTSFATASSGEFLDLDPSRTIIPLVDGFGGTGLLNGMAGGGFFGNTAGAAFSFPISAQDEGLDVAMQAAMFDPSVATTINLSAAGHWRVSAPPTEIRFSGDEEVVRFAPPGGPIQLYGQSFSHLSVSTNGWIKFGGFAAHADPTPSAFDFRNGYVGSGVAGPILSACWDDLNLGNAPGQGLQEVIVREIFPGIIEVVWAHADLFPNIPLGTVRMTIDSSNGPAFIALDYTECSLAQPLSFGLVGISDGGTSPTAVQVHPLNWLTSGAIQSLAPAGLAPRVLFQDFGAGSHSEPFDLCGTAPTLADLGNGQGAFGLF